MSNKKLTQENVENIYNLNNQQNFFTSSIEKILTDEKENLYSILDNLHNRSFDPDFILTVKEFEVLGALSFLVNSLGFEYSSQDYFVKIVCDKISDRFKKLDVSNETKKLFVLCLNDKILNGKTINDIKNELISDFTKEFNFTSNAQKLQYSKMRQHIKNVFNTSIAPISLANSIDKLIATQNHTPQSILSVNSGITKNIQFTGNTLKHHKNLYTNELFVELLNMSIKKEQSKNISFILTESIISLIETQKKFNDTDNLNLLQILSFDSLSDDDKNAFIEKSKDEYTKKLESQNKEVAKPIEKELEQNVFDSDKLLFLVKMLEQTNNIAINSIEKLIESAETIFKKEDYAQHVMTYIYENIKSKAFAIKCDETKFLQEKESYETIMSYFGGLKNRFEELMKTLCKDIDEVKLHKIVSYINATIYDLVLDSQDQKQYLISQVSENSIKTYHHLASMINVIESCKCTNTHSYAVLYNFINEDSECVNIFDLSKQISDVDSKMKFFTPFFKLISVLQNGYDETTETPKMSVVSDETPNQQQA